MNKTFESFISEQLLFGNVGKIMQGKGSQSGVLGDKLQTAVASLAGFY